MELRAASLRELVRLCVETGREDAWDELIGRVQPTFARIACHMALRCGPIRPQEIDDIVQEMLLKIAHGRSESLRRLPQESDEDAMAYLKCSAANTARDYFRIKRAGKRGLEKTGNLDDEAGERLAAEMTGIDVDRRVLLSQIDCALQVKPQERTVFWLYYRTGLSAKEIAALPSVQLGPKGVESLLRRMTTVVREALAARSKGTN
ncbi:MAG TPA: sigma-70 family RNA polymerase sigma factor [Candidatus Acidoferrum sp.]|nr:sigma-70 family RNA polymerase sigma factor [Candidatus Acidoferrum sp.]